MDALKTHRDLPVQAVLDTRYFSDKRIVTVLRLETISSIAQKLLANGKATNEVDAIEQAKIKIKATR